MSDGESWTRGGRETDVAFEANKPFGVVGCGLIPWVVVVVDYPASLILDLFIRREL